MWDSNVVGNRARHFILLGCLLAILIVGTAVAADKNTQEPTKSGPNEPRKYGPYCGLYRLYTTIKLDSQEANFQELVKP